MTLVDARLSQSAKLCSVALFGLALPCGGLVFMMLRSRRTHMSDDRPSMALPGVLDGVAGTLTYRLRGHAVACGHAHERGRATALAPQAHRIRSRHRAHGSLGGVGVTPTFV